jgi:hypothetical protein
MLIDAAMFNCRQTGRNMHQHYNHSHSSAGIYTAPPAATRRLSTDACRHLDGPSAR